MTLVKIKQIPENLSLYILIKHKLWRESCNLNQLFRFYAIKETIQKSNV